MRRFFCLAALLAAFIVSPVLAQGTGQTPAAAPAPAPTDVKAGSIDLADVPYPYPVSFLPLTMYGQEVRMAYMDVPPAGQPNGRTVVVCPIDTTPGTTCATCQLCSRMRSTIIGFPATGGLKHRINKEPANDPGNPSIAV
jgi:hypothetical protein